MQEKNEMEQFLGLDEIEQEMLAELFKTFGDVSRIKLLSILSEGEICVTDLAARVEMTQSAVSHQLKFLKQNRLIKNRRDGKQIYYALDDEHVRLILRMGMEHILEK